jgi:hypothetical protein
MKVLYCRDLELLPEIEPACITIVETGVVEDSVLSASGSILMAPPLVTVTTP